MTSEKPPLYRAVSGDMVDPNLVPRLEDIGNIVRLLADHIYFIGSMQPGDVMTFSIHQNVPVVEVRRSPHTGHSYYLNGRYVSDVRWAQMAYMQMVFDGLGLDSGVSPSLYYDNDGKETETGGTSYVKDAEAN